MTAKKTILKAVESAKKPRSSKKTASGGGGGSGKSEIKRVGEYCVTNGAYHQRKAVRGNDDYVEFPLCNFTCKIVEEVTQDTGLEDQSILRIEGSRQDGLPLPVADVPASTFYGGQGNWANDAWGTRAFIYPGSQKKDNLRACIHQFSQLERDIPIRTVYQFTGWKKIDDEWHYLSGSGAIASSGLDVSVKVDLGGGHMADYALPAPPSKEQLKKEQLKNASSLVLDLLEICPAKKLIGAAVFCAVARAPLGECHPTDFALFIQGRTGSRKSSIAAVALAFFGDFKDNQFPSNWSDTDNDMEAKAFQAKDSVFVVDDFKPSVSPAEASKLYAKAERFVRNTGNQAGRGRRGADMKARPAPYNRSMTIITAEDLPKGQSLLGRMLILELIESDVNISTLSKLQCASRQGELSFLMSAYLQWLAPRLDELKKEFPKTVTVLRDAFIGDGIATSHSRAPGIFANMVAGMEIFMEFMVDTELLTSEQSNIILCDIEEYLKDAFSEQAAYQVEQDETVRFLELLRASFSAGNAHIACRLKQEPPATRPHAWGWRSNEVDLSGNKIYKPAGDCVGWYCDKNREVWLERNSAYAVVQRLAKIQGDAFLLSPPSLWRRMYEKGLILSVESSGTKTPRLAVKRVIAGADKRVLILSADLVESEV